MANQTHSRPLNANYAGTPAYRPDIDGLRAFSILSVLIFHAFPGALPGGFIGVDVFFVISGFLISGIILKSLNAGTFSYANFYSRRVKRIFPALIAVLCACMIAGWQVLLQDEWKSLGKHVFGGAAFISNILLMREGGYFDSGAKPLLHLWSLGIEEQFYFAWPLLLAFVYKRRPVLLPSILAVLFLSFALNVWYVEKQSTYDFYFPAMRFWELALGALLAYRMLFGSKTRFRWLQTDFIQSPKILSASSLVGLSLLIVSIVWIDQQKAFPGIWALLPTMGAVLTIAAGPKGWFNRVVLSSRPMIFLGLISYPLYLWHWPMLVFENLLNPNHRTWPIVAALFASVGLAYLTYKVVESPLRHHRSAVAVPCMLSLSVAFLGLFGLVCYYKVPARLQNSANGRIAAAAIADWDYPFGFNYRGRSNFETGQIAGRGDGKVLFIGDSHAEQYYQRVKTLSEDQPDRFPTSIFATYGGCPPFPHATVRVPGFACDEFFDYAMTRARDPQVKTIVFCAYWEFYFGYEVDGNKESRFYRSGENPRAKRPALQLADLAFSDLGCSIQSLTARGKQVFLILSNPTSSLYDPRQMIRRVTGAIETRDLDVHKLEASRPILARVRAMAVRSGAIVIDPLPYFCGDSTCRTTSDEGLPVYKDSDHLRSSFVNRYAKFVDQIYVDQIHQERAPSSFEPSMAGR